MKNTLMIPLVFLVSLVTWVAIITVFSVLAAPSGLAALASGDERALIIAFAQRSLFLVPVGVMIALVSVFFFFMRHETVLFVSIPLVIALACSSVLLGIPLSYAALGRLDGEAPAVFGETGAMFAPGYIRGDARFESFRWLDLAEKDAATRLIASADPRSASAALSIYPDVSYDAKSLTLRSDSGAEIARAGGQDPLYDSFVEPPAFLRGLAADCARVLAAFRFAYASGAREYAFVAGSFFLAVATLWFFCYATKWRMLNVLVSLSLLWVFFFCFPYASQGTLPNLIARFLPAAIPASRVSPLMYFSFAVITAVVSLIVCLVRIISRASRGGLHG